MLKSRKVWLGLLLGMTLLAAVWPVPEEADPRPTIMARRTGPDARRDAQVERAPPVRFAPISEPVRTTAPRPIGDLFPAQSWVVAKIDSAPSAPTAPPLPYSYGGSFRDGNVRWVYLIEGGEMRGVKEGDVVNGTYRVDKFETQQITLTYLPLGISQRLSTGGVLP